MSNENFDKSMPPKVEHTGPSLGQQEPKTHVQEDRQRVLNQGELDDYVLSRDQERREIRHPVRFGYDDLIAYALNVAKYMNGDEPKNYKEATSCKEMGHWKPAMEEELNSL